MQQLLTRQTFAVLFQFRGGNFTPVAAMCGALKMTPSTNSKCFLTSNGRIRAFRLGVPQSLDVGGVTRNYWSRCVPLSQLQLEVVEALILKAQLQSNNPDEGG
jgi:hypothetical protein